jgi:phospholipid/cholesterol/gamma-HCH transport system substrate-binding protein
LNKHIMSKRIINNVKLGAFVIAGLLFLILLLYMIGKNRNLFSSNYILKARFENVQGLKPGNNIRYSGIEVGTVKKVTFLNDTLIEVTMVIDTKMKDIIRKNAVASIGTEGFVGNKVLNISPGKQSAIAAEEGDVLWTKKAIDTDEMLRTLDKTNNDIAIIAENLKTTIFNINSSDALWEILNEKTLPDNIRSSANNIRLATARAANMVEDLHNLVNDVKNGKGSLGAILTDSSYALNLNEAIQKIKSVGEHADTLAEEIHKVVKSVNNDLNNGKGVMNTLLKDSSVVNKLHKGLDNIEKGTNAFNQDMEALKHNFLLRGYFRKLEKQKQKEENNNTSVGN